uniref:Integrase catalytic domain-containing protein n=1 Tax=Oryzias sinensis TaxID=183150 RepID=A0A8C7WU94_9TELE
MCAATRFPEAVPLRKITARSVIKALTKFFSTFGLPKTIQTDQGTNFKPGLFKQITQTLGINHITSSAYHPESQGALECWHQTLKAMLRKYCLELKKNWDEGVPFVLFAARESVQESLGFSPAELVFGHTPRGPLQALKEKLLSPVEDKRKSVRVYVREFNDRLRCANKLAKECLVSSQLKMKQRHDRVAVKREFHPGDKVLALLPVLGSSLSAKFTGPLEVQQVLKNNNYLLGSSDKRRKARVCHINMLKPYHSRGVSEPTVTPTPQISAAVTVQPEKPEEPEEDDGLRIPKKIQPLPA